MALSKQNYHLIIYVFNYLSWLGGVVEEPLEIICLVCYQVVQRDFLSQVHPGFHIKIPMKKKKKQINANNLQNVGSRDIASISTQNLPIQSTDTKVGIACELTTNLMLVESFIGGLVGTFGLQKTQQGYQISWQDHQCLTAFSKNSLSLVKYSYPKNPSQLFQDNIFGLSYTLLNLFPQFLSFFALSWKILITSSISTIQVF